MSPDADAKATILRIVGEQPDESTYDEILRELAFHRVVEHGLAGDRDRTVGTEEVRRRLRSWRA